MSDKIPKTSSFPGIGQFDYDWDKKICGDDPLEEKCCCDGYSIESVIERSYDLGLQDRPEVKLLEKWPCLDCKQLDVLVDKLNGIASAKDPKPNKAPGLCALPASLTWEKSLGAMKDFLNKLFSN